jgi:hypothetical protein
MDKIKAKILRINIGHRFIESFLFVINVIFSTQRLDEWLNLVAIVPWHRRKQMVFYLKVQVTGKPIVEPRLLHVASCLKLTTEPTKLFVIVDWHWQMAHLDRNEDFKNV